MAEEAICYENAEEEAMEANDWTTMELSPYVEQQEHPILQDIPIQPNTGQLVDPENNNVASDCMGVDQLQCFTSDKDLQSDMGQAEQLDIDLTNHFTTKKVFKSREELITWATRVGKRVGCVIVIKNSNHSTSGKKPNLFLGCQRGGKYRSHKKVTENQDEKKKRKRKYGTKKCECPFVLRGICLPGPRDRWKVSVDCGHHNHPLETDLDGHPHSGRLTPEEEKVLLELTLSGEKPKEVLDKIKERDPSNSSKLKHIYNARTKLKSIEKNGKSQMQSLMPLLEENDYVAWHRRDHESDSLTGLFWAHPESVQLAKCFPCVLIIESIKKATKHRWPVFEVVGVTSTMVSFSVCFAMFEKERDDNYLWALGRLHALLGDNLPLVIVTDGDISLFSSIEKIFPDARQLLCRCHVQMNVLAKAKSLLDEDECKRFIDKWKDVVLSSTPEKFAIQLEELEIYFSQYPDFIQYIKETWLPRKEFFISSWIDDCMHLGCTTTSRVETAHARLKRQRVWFDFVNLWKIMHSMINEQITDIRLSFERSLKSVKHEYEILILKELRGFIPKGAIDVILSERQRALSIGFTPESCGCVIHYTHGLPCAHEIATYESDERPIPLSAIHPFWKRLSDIPTLRGHGGLDSDPEFQMFVKHYEESDDVRRMFLLKSLQQLTDYVTPSLIEPQEEIEMGEQPNDNQQRMVVQFNSAAEEEVSPLEEVLPLQT